MSIQSIQSEESSPTSLTQQNQQSKTGCRYSFAEYGIIFCAAFMVRMLHILALKASPIFHYKIGDAARYDQWAKTIADGSWLGEGVFYQAPLYPYFLGVIYQLVGDDILTVRRVQALLGAVSCLFIMKAAGNLFGKRPGMIAGLILAFYAPSIFLEGLIQKSILDLFFLSLLLFLFTQTLRSKHFGYWLGNWAGDWGLVFDTRERTCARSDSRIVDSHWRLKVDRDSMQRIHRIHNNDNDVEKGFVDSRLGRRSLLDTRSSRPSELFNWRAFSFDHLTVGAKFLYR